MDAVIMDFNTPLESFIEATGPCSDIIMTEDWNGPNTGVYVYMYMSLSLARSLALPLSLSFTISPTHSLATLYYYRYIVKNTPWSRWFLAHAWELGLPLVPKTNPEGYKHPFQYEQRVVHYLLESSVWTKRTLSKYHAPGAADSLRVRLSLSLSLTHTHTHTH